MKNLLTICLVIASLVISHTAMGAVTVMFDNTSNVNITPGISQYQTTGADMVDILVTATFLDGSTETSAWAATGATSGQSAGKGWTLSVGGDTFSTDAWTLSLDDRTALKNVYIEAIPGLTVFDIDWSPYPGTPGSADGRTFAATTLLNITATYSDLVGVNGASPVGDIYGNLNIAFTDNGGTGLGLTLPFSADADNIVPEPATMLLLGLGGLVLRKRR